MAREHACYKRNVAYRKCVYDYCMTVLLTHILNYIMILWFTKTSIYGFIGTF